MQELGLNFDTEYPFWPLVYGPYETGPVSGIGMCVSGTIANYSVSPAKNVFVILDVYDRTGAKVDDAIDSTLSIGSGETWKYQIPIWLRDGRTARLREIRFRH